MRRLLIVFAFGACSTNAPTLSETDQALVGVTGTTSFPNTQVGMSSAAQSFTASETTRTLGDHLENVTISYSCPDFTVTPLTGTVENDCEQIGCPGAAPCIEPTGGIVCVPEETFPFTAVFHPTVAAAVSCTLTISDGAGITLTGTGTAPPIHVTASPSSIGFGGVRVATTSSAVNVTVTNSGGSPATISSVTVAGTGYTIASGTSTSHTLAANTSETHGVTCSPGQTVGALPAGTLTINSNDPTTPTINIGLSCSGITSKIAVTPSPVVIPTTRVGEPVMQTITLQNTGAASATLVDVTVTGMTMVSAPAANTPLAANATAQAVVSFDASAAGSASGNLHIDTDTTPLDIPITAQALATSMSLTPDGSVDFGPVCAGQTSTQMFALVANEAGAFELTAVSQPAAPFAVTTPTLPASVQGNAANTVSFSVTAAPTDVGSTQRRRRSTSTPISRWGSPIRSTWRSRRLPSGVTPTPAMVDRLRGTVAVQTTSQGQSDHASRTAAHRR